MTPVKATTLLNDIGTPSRRRKEQALPPDYDVPLPAKVPSAIASTGGISCSCPLENHATHGGNCRLCARVSPAVDDRSYL
jgi:hypothetical protein